MPSPAMQLPTFLAALCLLSGLVESAGDEHLYILPDVIESPTSLTAEDFENAKLVPRDEPLPAVVPMDAANLFEGDIANPGLNAQTIRYFVREEGDEARSGVAMNAIRSRYKLWTASAVPYQISSRYSSYSRARIAAAMDEYGRRTCIRFVPKTSETDYLYILPDSGCYSMVGKTRGQQVLSLGSGCVHVGIIEHELMHAVGFFHEQSRADRDSFVDIQWNNIQNGMAGQFQKYNLRVISHLGTNYDYGSIMHYGSRDFSRNGQQTIVPKQAGARIGQRSGFSQTDVTKINTLYQCDGGGIVTTTSRPTPRTTTTRRPRTTTRSSPVGGSCVDDTRYDCGRLKNNGYCRYNWMQTSCPKTCGICRDTTDCDDTRSDCNWMVNLGYCNRYREFMTRNCRKSCQLCAGGPATTSTTTPTTTTRASASCTDKLNNCSVWAKNGFCRGSFVAFMSKNCPASCDRC